MFTTIKNAITKTPKIVIAVLASMLILAAPAMVIAGFGPERPVFDYTKYDASDPTCRAASNANGQCGSMNGPVFNSFINTPTYGDERNFTRISEVTAGDTNPNDNDYTETATATAGKEYWVRTLVHNNANSATNCTQEHLDAQGHCTQIDADAPGVAHNANVRVAIADGASNGVDIMTYVSASNATPTTVYDTAGLANENQEFSVSYVNGSAKLYNRINQENGVALPDSIAGANGAAIGYDQMNGNLPGCFDFSAYVYVKVKVNIPNLQVQKFVSNDNGASFKEQVNASLGNNVKWQIKYQNNGNTVAHNVTLRDTLPDGVTLVPGSVRLYKGLDNTTDGKVVPDNALGGGNVGDVAAGEGGRLEFETKINNDYKSCELKNVAFVRGDSVPETSDNSQVMIENCKPTTVSYSCVELQPLTILANRTIRTNELKYTSTTGATFKNVSYDFGDATPPLVTDKTKDIPHTYSDDNTHIVKATVTFSVNGVDKVAEVNPACAKPVSFTAKPVSTPTTLPNTGPGEMLGIFAAVTVAGTLAYRFILGRRYS